MVIQIRCGIGNQLFQYAFARAYSLRHGIAFLVDWEVPETRPDLRPYRLDCFRVASREATEADIARLERSAWRRWWSLRRARSGHGVSRSHLNRINERHEFTVDPRHATSLPGTYWIGWWQNRLYFQPWESRIRQDLVFTAPLSREVRRFAVDLQRAGSIGLHVRRTDYISAALHAGICDVAYYHEALAWMRARLSRPEVFVFSDDIPWARDNLGLPGRVTFVDAYARDGDHVDFHLLSRCRHHIIANSTFSWWAAWLASSDEQLVCAPRRWVNRQDDPGPRMYPGHWNVIDV